MDPLLPGVTLEWAVKMAAGFVASVAGIVLWSHNRQSSWVFIVLATLLAYSKVLLDFVDRLGLYALDSWQPGGVPVLRLGFAAGVPLLYAVGLFLAYRSHYRGHG